jgi:ubiquinone/menaquinone biosynthesis C-methylase UbiE
MSTYSKKLREGAIPTDQDWQDHLVEAHHRAPSMTPKAFADHKTKDGINSYQLLANALQKNGQRADLVIDLACGDGFLFQYILPKLSKSARIIGIDMSEAELAIAKQSVNDPRASFICGRAQTLPIPSQSADFVLCHMALMLMLPIEPVIGEVARILKPAGCFSAVVSSPLAMSGFFKEIQKIVFHSIKENFSGVANARSGDSRVATSEGLKTLFQTQTGFSDAHEISDFELGVNLTPDGVWTLMRDMYFVGMLPDEAKERLRAELTAFAETKIDPSGKVSFTFPLRQITVFKLQ